MLWVKGLARDGQAQMAAAGGEALTDEQKATIKQIILSGHLNIAMAQLKVRACGEAVVRQNNSMARTGERSGGADHFRRRSGGSELACARAISNCGSSGGLDPALLPSGGSCDRVSFRWALAAVKIDMTETTRTTRHIVSAVRTRPPRPFGTLIIRGTNASTAAPRCALPNSSQLERWDRVEVNCTTVLQMDDKNVKVRSRLVGLLLMVPKQTRVGSSDGHAFCPHLSQALFRRAKSHIGRGNYYSAEDDFKRRAPPSLFADLCAALMSRRVDLMADVPSACIAQGEGARAFE